MTDNTHSSLSGGHQDRLSEKLLHLGQGILVVVFGLLPVFFIPSVAAPLGYTKTALVFVGLLLALALFSFAILRAGAGRIVVFLPLAILWLIGLVGLASSALSGDFMGSFMGDGFNIGTTAFLLLLAGTVTLSAQLMRSRTAAMRFYMLFLGSTFLLAVFHFLRLLVGPDNLTFAVFGGNGTLSPLGSWNDVALFFGLAILLALVALEQLSLSRVGRILFALMAVLALGMLTIINFFAVWVVLGIVSLVILVYGLAKDRIAPQSGSHSTDRRISGVSLAVSSIVFIVSALFIIGGSFFGGMISQATDISYIEVRPSFQATADIARNAYSDSAIFGVGPNKFVEAWRQYRDTSINNTLFWNTDFSAGVGYIPTFFVTMGIIGGLLWLAFIGLFFFAGIRMLIRAPADSDRLWYFIGVSAFVAAAYVWGFSLVYVPGPVLLLLAAFCTGVMFAANAQLLKGREFTFAFRSNRGFNFMIVTGIVLVILMAVASFYWVGRHYASAVVFSQGVVALFEGDVDRSEALTAQAYTLSPDDRYARRIAEIQYARLVEMLNLPGEPTADVQARFEQMLVSSVQAARTAVSLNASDANNWAMLGTVYTLLTSLEIEGAYEEARNQLNEARSRDPQNPVRTLALGQLELVRGEQGEARTLINDAIRLKPDYTEAILALSQIDIAENNIAGAIDSARQVISIEPQNPVRYFQLGLLELAREEYAEGIRALEAALVLQPEYANARYYLALAYDAAGRPNDAETQLEEVLATNPGNEIVEQLLATLRAGGSIADQLETGIGESPVSTGAGDTEDEAPVDGDALTDSPLLTPVNTPPAESEDNG